MSTPSPQSCRCALRDKGLLFQLFMSCLPAPASSQYLIILQCPTHECDEGSVQSYMHLVSPENWQQSGEANELIHFSSTCSPEDLRSIVSRDTDFIPPGIAVWSKVSFPCKISSSGHIPLAAWIKAGAQ